MAIYQHANQNSGTPASGNSGNGGNVSIESRVTALEIHLEYTTKHLGKIDEKSDAILSKIDDLIIKSTDQPKRVDLWIMISTVFGVAIAMISVVIAALQLKNS